MRVNESGIKPPTKPSEVEDHYKQWWLDRTPDNLGKVVKALEPTVSYKLASMGIADNPQMRHQARLYVADAVKTFDPASGTNIRTWAQNQLQSLHRFKRENQGPVKIPDRAAIDAWAIEKASREFLDQHGFEPDVKQLADYSNISVKRIATVRKLTRPVAAASQMFDEGNDPVDFLGESLEYVYDSADQIDRKIIDHTTGYGGAKVMQKNEIAAMLGISPSQVTRRADRIGQQIQEMENDIKSTYA